MPIEIWEYMDSAAGSAKDGRDPKIQAIYSMRGKNLNVEKASIERILANKEFSDIVGCLGIGFGDKIDVSKSRYGKVIIMTDADVDGRR